MIGFFHWLFGGILVVTFTILLVSIPSIITMFSMGISNYWKQLRLLITLKNKIDKGYKFSTNQIQTYCCTNPYYNKTVNITRTEYYFPIFVDKDNVIIVSFDDSIYSRVWIVKHQFKDNEWLSDQIIVSAKYCAFTELIYGSFRKRLDKLMESSEPVDGSDGFNKFINSKISSIRRDSILSSILK